MSYGVGAALTFKGTLKLQTNGPLYSNTVIGTLAVDGWAVPNVTAHPSTASVLTSYYLMWHYITSGL